MNEENKEKKPKQKPKRSANLRAHKAIENMLNGMAQGPAMVEAGYSETYATNPALFRASKDYKEAVNSYLDRIMALRERVYGVLVEKGDKEFSKIEILDAIKALKHLTHDIQLLSGGKTENPGLDDLTGAIKTLLKEVREK